MANELIRALEKVQHSVNDLQDQIDIHCDEKRLSDQLLEILEDIQTSFPTHSTFLGLIELLHREEGKESTN